MTEWISPGESKPTLVSDKLDSNNPSNLLTIDDFYCTIEVEAKNKPPKDNLSKRFINLIGQGYKPGEAARRVGTSIQGLMSDNKIKKQIENLAKNYHLTADVRRQLVRMSTTKILLDNIEGDTNQQKLALDAAKSIGSDTEVGINAPPQPGIQINVGNLAGLFSSIDIPQEEQETIIDIQPILKPNDSTEDQFRIEGLGEFEQDNSPILTEEQIRKLTEESS